MDPEEPDPLFRGQIPSDGFASDRNEAIRDAVGSTGVLRFAEGLIYGILLGSVFWASVIWIII